MDFFDDFMDDIAKMDSEVSNSIKQRIALLKEQKRDYVKNSNSEKEINSLKKEIKELEEKYNGFFLKKIGE